jgi:hypothetical protein
MIQSDLGTNNSAVWNQKNLKDPDDIGAFNLHYAPITFDPSKTDNSDFYRNV